MIRHFVLLFVTGLLPGQTKEPPGRNLPGQVTQPGVGSIFISGKVLLDEGSGPPEPVLIERVCHGTPKPEGRTDAKGNFHFELGRNHGMMADASYSNSGVNSTLEKATTQTNAPGAVHAALRDLVGCELRASLPGYVSDVVNLSGRRALDSPNVGTLVLRRRANVEGLTTSATSLVAPKAAKKAYEKALKLAKSKKMTEARKELESAVAAYPKYAVAWYELGLMHERENRLPQANQAYAKALEADPKFIKPYLQMAGLAALASRWMETSEISAAAIRLNPYDFPAAYFYHSIAALNLHDLDVAEKSAREGRKLDSQNLIPRLAYVLGIALAGKQEFSAAAENLRLYLKLAPDSPDAASIKEQLAAIERNAADR